MKHVRPIDLTAQSQQDWLLAPAEGTGCGIRIMRGAGKAELTAEPALERFALVLKGQPQLVTAAGITPAAPGDLIFIPAGTAAAVSGGDDAVWAAIEAAVDEPAGAPTAAATVISVDQSRFEGSGFAYQSLIDRTLGAQTMRMNALQVEPGSGSPDYHIHAFAQIYVIQEGEMTIDIGYDRIVAPACSLVVLPAGVVHRNFNASSGIERHVSLLVPEPAEGQIFDYAVTIHDKEAELLTAVPAARG